MLPQVIGEHTQEVNIPHAPQVKGLAEHVVPQVIGELTQVVPQTIGEQTLVEPVIKGEQTYALALILPVTVKLVPSKVIFGFEQIHVAETYVPTPFEVVPAQLMPPPVVVPLSNVPSVLKYAIQVSDVFAATDVNFKFAPHIQVLPIIIGEQAQVVNKPHAPHNNVAVIQVVPLIMGDFMQVAKQPHAPQ